MFASTSFALQKANLFGFNSHQLLKAAGSTQMGSHLHLRLFSGRIRDRHCFICGQLGHISCVASPSSALPLFIRFMLAQLPNPTNHYYEHTFSCVSLSYSPFAARTARREAAACACSCATPAASRATQSTCSRCRNAGMQECMQTHTHKNAHLYLHPYAHAHHTNARTRFRGCRRDCPEQKGGRKCYSCGEYGHSA